MFKKGLSLLASIGMVAITATSVVSCIEPKYAFGEEGQRVVLATDGGRIDDKSFNENAYHGISRYMKEEYNLSASNNYVEAADSSINGKVSAYKMAATKKADAMVLPGFGHLETLAQATSFFKNKSIVLLDGIANYEGQPEANKNVISVQFNSQLSGVQAGFDASYWATRKDAKGNLMGDASGDGTISIGSFAGASNKYGVDNYMWGLFIGIELFNQTIGKKEGQTVSFANNSKHTLAGMDIASSSDPHFFSNSFALGDAEKTGVLNYLIDNNNADIVFPVAGPQIQDTLQHKTKTGHQYQPYVIGVDVDQADAFEYEANKGRFITSAIKNLDSATVLSLEHASSLKNSKGEMHSEENTQGGLWDGKVAPVQNNWSIDMIGGLNRIAKHKLLLFEGQNNDVQSDDTSIKESDYFIHTINDIFANVGETSDIYFKGSNLQDSFDKLWKVFEEKNLGDKIIASDDDVNEETINNQKFVD